MCPSMRCSTSSPLFFSLSVIDLVILEKYYKNLFFFFFFAIIAWAFPRKQGRDRREGLRREFRVRVPLGCRSWLIMPSVMRDLDYDHKHAQGGSRIPIPSKLPVLQVEMSQCSSFCCVHWTFFFSSHKILESIYAWNRYENLVGVRLSFSSGVSPSPEFSWVMVQTPFDSRSYSQHLQLYE